MTPLAAWAACLTGLVILALNAARAEAQLPAYLLDDRTEVGSIHFRYLGSETFSSSRLRRQIALTDRGRAYGLKQSLSFLPFVSDPGEHPFNPLDLQRDVARLRGFYQEAGFPEVGIRYDVALSEEENLVDVEFLVAEGRPRILATLTYSGVAGAPVEDHLAPDLHPGWRDFLAAQRRRVGSRLGSAERAQLEASAVLWLKERGYPFPVASSRVDTDSTGLQADLLVEVEPGMRRRVGSIEVEGNTSVGTDVILRELPLNVGDWYSASRLADGRRRVFSLDLFRLALADVQPSAEADSTVQVRLRVEESRPRSISGYTGYTNVGGVAFGGQWEHRNFVGGARTLAVNGTAETGALAMAELPDQYFRGSVSLRQPFLFVSGLSFVASPFGEYRDDYRDRSWELGADGTLVYQLAPLQAISLRYRISTRKVLEYRVADEGIGLEDILGPGVDEESLTADVVTSALTLSASLGTLDNPANPTRGITFQPSLEVTVPPGYPTNEYLKAELWGAAYRPLRDRVQAAAALRMGRLFPFGASVPAEGDAEDGLLKFLQLRDVNLTAGGPTDVRGWGTHLLGPKVPDIHVRGMEGDSVEYTAALYLPVGGLARVSAALELRLPFPGMGPRFSSHLFLDGGRVWTPDHRYLPGSDPYGQQDFFYSTGGGVGIDTPVGPIRVTLGYKLNPSPLDLRDPGEVLALLLQERDILEAEVRNRRRFQLHLTIGRVF